MENIKQWRLETREGIIEFLNYLNKEFPRLSSNYEQVWWKVMMGDDSFMDEKTNAKKELDAFKSNRENLANVRIALQHANATEAEKLKLWESFFDSYQIPEKLVPLREQIDDLEAKIDKERRTRTEGYIDPETGEFTQVSKVQMREMMGTHESEAVRKACYDAFEKMSEDSLEDYVTLVGLRNEYARALGFDDFYAMKLWQEERMTKETLFSLFDEIYEGTKGMFDDIREMEKKQPGLRSPWNFGYMTSGDFAREEEPYFQFEDAMIRWGRSFSALGIDYKGGTIKLDLLQRDGKYNNGFCHWPELVRFDGEKRIPGEAGFTTNVVPGQMRSGRTGMNTLFHEGGHAAHLLGSEQTETAVNHEYQPSSTAWAETQSMFLDTMFNSVEWRMKYAKDADGNPYPFELFERKVKKLNKLAALQMMSIMHVSEFERQIYEHENLTPEEILRIARETDEKYKDRSDSSISVLDTPHLYSWESAASYHGYALATLALDQWRAYFYEKYGYIVDNPEVGREMMEVWELGMSKTFEEFVLIATGKELSADSFIATTTMSEEEVIAQAKERVVRVMEIPEQTGPIDMNVTIIMVDGKEVISTNEESFEEMARIYAEFIRARLVS